jgi:hypothetical protein
MSNSRTAVDYMRKENVMCPICISTTVLVVAGTTSTAGIAGVAALVARQWNRKKGEQNAATKNRDAR